MNEPRIKPIVVGILWGLGLFLMVAIFGYPIGYRIELVPVLSGCVIACMVCRFIYDLADTTNPPSWPHPPIELTLPNAPNEVRARRLFTYLTESTELGRQEIANAIRDLVIERLVANHGADPEDPFQHAHAVLSPDLSNYLITAATADAKAPSLTRSAIHAYLKEIDAL
ncbi:MAG: hypothetical protein ACRDAX_01175 [Propionibacteriaceae bacterium]